MLSFALPNVDLARVWEREPAVFRRGAPPLDAREAFQILVAAAADPHGRVRFFEDAPEPLAGAQARLPGRADRDLATYLARAAREAGPAGFALVVNAAHRHDFALYEAARALIAQVQLQCGAQEALADCDLFLGNYRRTPFGVHKDSASNFCFVLEGTKRFLLWPYEVLEAAAGVSGARGKLVLPDRLDPGPFRDRARVLEGRPGDVIYWPSSYWHVAESSGETAVVTNLALYLDPPPPPADARAAQEARTRACFGSAPALAELDALHPGDVLGAPHPGSLAWSEQGGALVVSANGRSIALPYHQEIAAFLETLGGDNVEAHLARAPIDDAAAGALLLKLCRFGALPVSRHTP